MTALADILHGKPAGQLLSFNTAISKLPLVSLATQLLSLSSSWEIKSILQVSGVLMWFVNLLAEAPDYEYSCVSNSCHELVNLFGLVNSTVPNRFVSFTVPIHPKRMHWEQVTKRLAWSSALIMLQQEFEWKISPLNHRHFFNKIRIMIAVSNIEICW